MAQFLECSSHTQFLTLRDIMKLTRVRWHHFPLFILSGLKSSIPCANNESSEVFGIVKPGRRVKLNRSQTKNVHKLLTIGYLHPVLMLLTEYYIGLLRSGNLGVFVERLNKCTCFGRLYTTYAKLIVSYE